MSRSTLSAAGGKRRGQAAPLFAALGDATRLALVARLSNGEFRSIAELTSGSRMSRQAITKHLRVLEHAGLVRCTQRGRESIFEFSPEPLSEARAYLDSVSAEWDAALARLKAFVEK